MKLADLLASPRLAAALSAAAIVLLLATLFWPARPRDPFADPARTQAAVAQAIRSNPDIVVEALQAMQQRQNQMEQAQQRQAVAARRDALERDPNSHVGGNPRGDVTLVEFFDYRCPYCRQAQATVNQLLAEDGNLRLVYKEFPILGPESVIASRAAVAARASERYPALHDALMTAPSPLTEENVLKIADSVGLNVSALQLDMGSPDVERIIAANRALAQELGIQGTPAFVIGDRLLPGVVSLDGLKQLVAAERAKAR